VNSLFLILSSRSNFLREYSSWINLIFSASAFLCYSSSNCALIFLCISSSSSCFLNAKPALNLRSLQFCSLFSSSISSMFFFLSFNLLKNCCFYSICLSYSANSSYACLPAVSLSSKSLTFLDIFCLLSLSISVFFRFSMKASISSSVFNPLL